MVASEIHVPPRNETVVFTVRTRIIPGFLQEFDPLWFPSGDSPTPVHCQHLEGHSLLSTSKFMEGGS